MINHRYHILIFQINNSKILLFEKAENRIRPHKILQKDEKL